MYDDWITTDKNEGGSSITTKGSGEPSYTDKYI